MFAIGIEVKFCHFINEKLSEFYVMINFISMKYFVQADQCKDCKHSIMNPTNQLICGKSNRKENFYGNCQQFIFGKPDLKKEQKLKKDYQEEQARKKSEKSGKPVAGSGTEDIQILLSALAILIGACLFIFAFIKFERILFYPPFLIVAGIFSLIRATNKKKGK